MTVVVGLAMPRLAAADVTIHFDDAGDASGTVSYGGAGGPMTATITGIDIVTFEDDSDANPPVDLTCVDCVLTFTTGNNTLEALIPGGPNNWLFSGGGSFVITGTIMDGATVVATGTLLEGVFNGANASQNANPGVMTIGGSGPDTKNADLLAYFGVTNDDFTFGTTDITANSCSSNASTGAFSCNVAEADVTNTNEPSTVPEPGLLSLFGLGLMGAGSAARKRFARK
jgi:hypothetical protein